MLWGGLAIFLTVVLYIFTKRAGYFMPFGLGQMSPLGLLKPGRWMGKGKAVKPAGKPCEI